VSEEQPKVYIGIPTGPPKDYAMMYMVAALQNLDWRNAEVHWAVSYKGDSEGDAYMEKLGGILDSVRWSIPWKIHRCDITQEEAQTPYRAVIRNRRLLRSDFLDGDCDYFFMVGGDNPPWRSAIKRLMKWNADVAFGLSYQRPRRDRWYPNAVYPMVWVYAWNLHELPDDIDEDLYEQFWQSFLNVTLYLPIYVIPNWRRKKRIWGVAGGDGNCLIRREVLENAGWTLPGTRGTPHGYHSEDLHFFNKVNLLGYSVVCDLKYRVPHFHSDGTIF
jgi:hypothetical protein